MRTINLLLTLLILSFIKLNAQQHITITSDEHSLYVIPAEFTHDSKPKIHSYSKESINTRGDYETGTFKSIKVYNDELSEVASIEYNPDRFLLYQHQHADLNWSIDAPLVVVSESFNYVDWVSMRFLDLRKGTVLGDPYADVILTQTLFNDDEKYEYIVPKYRLEEHREEHRESGDFGPIEDVYIDVDCYITGLEVKSEDGSTVYSLDFDTERDSDIECCVVLWEDKTYLAITDDSDHGYTCDMYLLKRESSNISLVKTGNINGIKLYPSATRKNTMVTVDLGGKTKDSDGTIFVTDTNGRTVYSKHVDTGIDSIQIPTHRLISGLYIVSLNTADNSYETAKLIVK